ncbi:hypothetical protein QBC40DRAFT_298744 [Triangularia verruculosa]|uniref:Uncharacterized protein n=1 Tax=Triangularia verruculosa TaxID=2587418 RepID=A0AAN7ASV6_9PEZI|nr:hypothetical protein QBC40DRAFT_298744 [Triangularia verruculosa]
MDRDYPHYTPPGTQRGRGGCRMLHCLLASALVAVSLAWAGFFATTGHFVPFCCHAHRYGYGYGYAVDGTDQDSPSTVLPAHEVVDQVSFQSSLTKRDHVGSDAVLPEPSYPPRIPNPQSERIEESYYNKHGQKVPLVRKPRKNPIVILPFPWGPYVYPIPWRPLRKKTGSTAGVLPMALVKASSPTPTPPSTAASSTPAADNQKHRGAGSNSRKEAYRQALWKQALAHWDKEERREIDNLVQDEENDNWYLQGFDMWIQYQDWFYEQGSRQNFMYKREFMAALVERYRSWMPGSDLPDQCYPIAETKYTVWDVKKEFPCLVAISKRQKEDSRFIRDSVSSSAGTVFPIIVPAVYEGDDKYILSCEFRINKNGNIEIRCPGMVSSHGKKFDQPEGSQETLRPSVTYKGPPVSPTRPTPTKPSATRVPPVYSIDHGPGPMIPSNVPHPPSSATVAPYRGQTIPTPFKFPTGRGPVMRPTPSASASYDGPVIIHEPQMCGPRKNITGPEAVKSVLDPLCTMSPAIPVFPVPSPTLLDSSWPSAATGQVVTIKPISVATWETRTVTKQASQPTVPP